MLLRKVLLASAATSLLAAPAAACDQHGPGQMGGFHRYNPFAHAFGNNGSPSNREEPIIIRRADSEKAKKEAKRRQEALEKKAEAEAALSEETRGRMGQGRQPALK